MIRDAAQAGQLHKPHFTCPVHKDYRVYQELLENLTNCEYETFFIQDELLKFSDWAIVGTTILSVPIVWPLTAVANTLDLNLVAIFKLFIIPVNSGWVPLTLAITWASASSTGIIAGSIKIWEKNSLFFNVRRCLWSFGRTPQLDDHLLCDRR